jgi:hypothetical protein
LGLLLLCLFDENSPLDLFFLLTPPRNHGEKDDKQSGAEGKKEEKKGEHVIAAAPGCAECLWVFSILCTTAKLWLCSRRAPKHHISTHTLGLIISLRCAALGDSF